MKKVFTHNKFKGHYPVGTAAVIVADTRVQAINLLNEKLRLRGLDGDADVDDLWEVDQNERSARILCDGNY